MQRGKNETKNISIQGEGQLPLHSSYIRSPLHLLLPVKLLYETPTPERHLVVYVVSLRPVIKEGRIERGETEFMVPQNCLGPSCGLHCY